MPTHRKQSSSFSSLQLTGKAMVECHLLQRSMLNSHFLTGLQLFQLQCYFQFRKCFPMQGKEKDIFNNSAKRNLAFKLCSALDVKADCPANQGLKFSVQSPKLAETFALTLFTTSPNYEDISIISQDNSQPKFFSPIWSLLNIIGNQ